MTMHRTGLAIILMAAIAGAVWAEPQTLEDVRAALEGKRFDTYAADIDIAMNMGGMSMNMDGHMIGQGSAMAMTMNMGMGGQAISTKMIVQDSGTMWVEANVNGTRQIMKGDRDTMKEMGMSMSGLSPGMIPQSQTMPATATEMLDMLGQMYDLAYAGTDTVNGAPVFVLDAEMKSEYADMFENSPQIQQMGLQFDKTRFAVGSDDGFVRRMEMLMPDGTAFMTQTYSNVVLNEALPDDAFEYTPPEGANVIDMVEQMKQLQRMQGNQQVPESGATP